MTSSVNPPEFGAFNVWQIDSKRYPNDEGCLHDHPVTKHLGMRYATDKMLKEVAFRLGRRNPEGLNVLDVGCGTGGTVEYLTVNNTRIVGIEPNIALADESRRRASDDLPIASALGQELPFCEGCFEVVIFEQVLSAIPKYQESLKEALRVLKPGGIIVINEMRIDFAKVPPPLRAGAKRSVFTRNLEFPDPDILLKELVNAGFISVEKSEIPFSLPKQLIGYVQDGGRNHLRAGIDLLRDPKARGTLIELATRMPWYLNSMSIAFYVGQKRLMV